jgi:hypothetical protein
MNALTSRFHGFFSQDIARRNAAQAASQAVRARRQRAEVQAFLEGVDQGPARPAHEGERRPLAKRSMGV